MSGLMDMPLLVFAVSFVVMALSAWIGTLLGTRRTLDADLREDFSVVQTATLTLLGLIIGFSFSMALTRYDQRKNYEEEEANAIGTEYVRAGLLPASDAAKIRELLHKYLDQRIRFYSTDQRILFYSTSNAQRLSEINSETARLQNELWAAVQAPALAQPTPISALAVWGMNDVLNTQGYTQAAWRNRIPIGAWALMGAIAVCANILVGLGAKSARSKRYLLIVLPFVVAIAFLLIADIDSPRGGIIHVSPQNLLSLVESLRVP